ncbi:MAG: hypothetical protein HY747_09585 [Elusimicrobia bacterium]|nr:hypothetical protein [Elusimicrobiota bacterium]
MGLVIFAYGAYGTLAQIALMRELAIVFSGYELFFGTALAAWLVSTGLGSFYARRLKADANTLFLFLTLSAVIFPAGMIAARLIKAHLSFGTMPGLFWTVTTNCGRHLVPANK